MPYSFESEDQVFLKSCGFLSFPKYRVTVSVKM